MSSSSFSDLDPAVVFPVRSSSSSRSSRSKSPAIPASLLGLDSALGINLLALQSAHDTLDRLSPGSANGAKVSSALQRLVQAQAAVDALTEHAVRQARLHKKSWAEIGHDLGVSPQAAHKRFRHVTQG